MVSLVAMLGLAMTAAPASAESRHHRAERLVTRYANEVSDVLYGGPAGASCLPSGHHRPHRRFVCDWEFTPEDGQGYYWGRVVIHFRRHGHGYRWRTAVLPECPGDPGYTP